MEYHKDTAPVLFERSSVPLDNHKASTRLIATIYRMGSLIRKAKSEDEVFYRPGRLIAWRSITTMLTQHSEPFAPT
jgi:hypothetical protein